MPQIGIRSSSFLSSQGRFGLAELNALAQTGFRLVELNFNHPSTGLDYEDASMGRRFRAEAQRHSLCLTAHAPTRLSLTSLDRDEVAAAICEYRRVLHGMIHYSIASIVIHACVDARIYAGREDEQLANLTAALAALADPCAQEGVHLWVETMIPGRITSAMDNLIAVIDAVGSPWIGICLDTNHLNLSEDITLATLRAGARLGEFHANDSQGDHEEHLLPYRGMVD